MRSVGLDAVALDRRGRRCACDPELPVGGAGLALLVDREADRRPAPYSRARLDHAVAGASPRASPSSRLAELRMRLAAEVLQPGLHHRRLGGVEHQGERGLGGEARRDLVHVDGAVAADVVDADVEDVRAFLDLLACHLHAACPSRPRASRRGTCGSRWRSCARRRRGTTSSWWNGTCDVDRSSSPARSSGVRGVGARARRSSRRPRRGARASCRSSRRRC